MGRTVCFGAELVCSFYMSLFVSGDRYSRTLGTLGSEKQQGVGVGREVRKCPKLTVLSMWEREETSRHKTALSSGPPPSPPPPQDKNRKLTWDGGRKWVY